MNQKIVLEKIAKNEITAYDAYNELYPERKTKIGKRAFFIKMSVKIPEEGKGINTFLKILFAIPIPIMFARMGIRIGKRFIKVDEVDFKEISRLIKYSKNTQISVESSDALVDIKIM
ncbi:MAG: hypothetical protein KAH16_01140 [Candidatus Izimaplasma sp.]|nr:hypothetical protein [Candidatus Izimaplasma bacterium]